MVIAEVPLWVNHGSNNNASATAAGGAAGALVPGMGGLANNNKPSNNESSSLDDANSNAININSQAAATIADQTAAKAALSLLSSTRSGGSGQRRAPMYSIDVHPDGTRFATAAGDGTVKIWSMGCLFAGKLNNEEGDGEGGDGQKKKGKNENEKRGKKKRGASSRFTDSGNYVSSNSEDYYDTSSSEERGSVDGRPPFQQQPLKPSLAPQGVNDLSGLVRKKKDKGKKASSAAIAAVAVNPFASTFNTTTNSASNNNEHPLSSLTQQRSDAAASTSATNANNTTGNANTSNNQSSSNPNKNNNLQPKKQHKLLSTITSHEGSVLSLRFSPSGIYLATAGDDSYVNIYIRSTSPSLAKGNLNGGGEANMDIEHWNRIAICRGHHLDVVGLAWAPDDSHLVSCSLDSVNPVIVWKLYHVLNNGGGGGEVDPTVGGLAAMGGMGDSPGVHIHNLHPFKILGRNIHTSTVKGVAFDPAGKYIVTSGDDPAICIWRASDEWGLEARVDAKNSGVFRSKKRRVRGNKSNPEENENEEEEEEEDDPGELASLSLFRRISFAPDGSHICGTNATLRGKNIAAMISREGWMASGGGGGNATGRPREGDNGATKPPPGAANLVGHKQPVVASRHCPVFLSVPKKSKSKLKRGSDDSSSSSSSSSEEDSEEEDGDVEYASLVALGDKRGFVTIWSTKSSRPLFKMQCSESKCTVTDLSWGVVRRNASQDDNGDNGDGKQQDGDSLVLIVSLLDGYVVALHFDIPTEVGGQILSDEQTRKIFRNKYGIDDFCSYGVSPGKNHQRRKRLVDDAGPMLIENALQLTMEMEAERMEEEDDEEDEDDESGEEEDSGEKGNEANKEGTKQTSSLKEDGVSSSVAGNIKDKQIVESTKNGKKRIRPVLMNANNNNAAVGDGVVTNNISDEDHRGAEKETGGKKKRRKKNKKQQPQPSDSLKGALDAASQAASVAEGVSTQAMHRDDGGGGGGVLGSGNAAETKGNNARPLAQATPMESHFTTGPALRIPYSTNKIFSVDLLTKSTTATLSSSALDNENGNTKIVADCTNSTTAASGTSSSSSSWPCATLTISRNGIRQWKDILLKAKCTALAANRQLLVVGTSDGCLYLYQTSPTLGWMSGKAFRAFPPFVLGSPVVEVSIGTSSLLNHGDHGTTPNSRSASCEMVVVTSDGNFYVYTLLPLGPKLNYKGSVVPAMQHMYLSSSSLSPPANQQRGGQPKMARIQLTDSKQLMLILVLPLTKSSSSGRLLQGFIYSRDMESWMRISDSNNFLLSDFYSSLPGGLVNGPQHQDGRGDDNVGILARMDRLVKSSASTMASAKQLYQKVAENHHDGSGGVAAAVTTSQKIVTRSHCEDRLACSIALGSASEFQTWLKYYARCLSLAGDGDALRFLVDVLLGGAGDGQASSTGDDDFIMDGGSQQQPIPSILSLAVGNKQSRLGLEGNDVIRRAILPEMSKNRLLQRLTNEISMELDCL